MYEFILIGIKFIKTSNSASLAKIVGIPLKNVNY